MLDKLLLALALGLEVLKVVGLMIMFVMAIVIVKKIMFE